MATVQDLKINIVAGTLPAGAVYNAQTYFNAIVNRMRATVDESNVLWGQLGGDEPTSSLSGVNGQPGLWFGNPNSGGHGYWNDWNDDAKKYLPIPLVCGQYISPNLRTTSIVCGAKTANRVLTTPDNDGTIALTSDITEQRGSQTYGGTGSFTIDCKDISPVHITMTGDVTIGLINYDNGMVIDFWVENGTGAGTFHLTIINAYFDAGALISTAIPLSPGVTGQRVIDHFRVFIEADYVFGQWVSKNHQIPTGADVTIPVPANAQMTNSSTIEIAMTNIMTGNSAVGATGFEVKVGGTVATVSSASCSGRNVTVNLAHSIASGATVTVKYTGTDMKSIGNLTVPVFGPTDVANSGGGGGIHNDV